MKMESPMTMTTLFLQPLDVLILRGNKLFADAGAFGEALMPPWPSVAAGALRSRMLADAGIDFPAFAAGRAGLSPELATCLGTPREPGAFRIGRFTLARKTEQGIEALMPLPADVVVSEDAPTNARYLRPTALHGSLASSQPLPLTPALRQSTPAKAVSGLWLTAAGQRAWLAGEPIPAAHLLRAGDLWKTDSRLGIALDPVERRAADGQLYTTEAIALNRDVGFVASVSGAEDLLPGDGLLRLGGDGHAAAVSRPACEWPQPDFAALAAAGRFRLLLTTPGLFAEGWRPGLREGRLHFPGASARLAAASVPRLETLSGWDLAAGRPKPALRAAPAGSVYWFDEFTGDAAALEALSREGLLVADALRRAEGFNNCLIAAWAREE